MPMIREKNRSFLSMFDSVEEDEDGGDIVFEKRQL
jgi:hypothetical protein